jgi:hypothetical protein
MHARRNKGVHVFVCIRRPQVLPGFIPQLHAQFDSFATLVASSFFFFDKEHILYHGDINYIQNLQQSIALAILWMHTAKKERRII